MGKVKPAPDTWTRQAEYYDRHYTYGHASSDNTAMAVWFSIKRLLKTFMKSQDQSITKRIKTLHRRWIQDTHRECVLDMGCGQGSSFSSWLAANSESYVGIDLSEVAVTQFQRLLNQKGIQDAKVRVMEFLDNDFTDDSFDLIYASAVLHHFANIDHLCREMHRVLKPNGIIVSSDPINTNAVSFVVRRIYQRFQTNRDWEWPFSKHTFNMLQQYFIVDAVQGFLGPLALLGFTVSLIPGFQRLGQAVYRRGIKSDEITAQRIGPALWRRNIVALRMRKM